MGREEAKTVQVTATEFPGLLVLRPKVIRDSRGYFLESYSRAVMAGHGVRCEFVQDNHALSVQPGVLRGLHFQLPPSAQAKLVRVSRGEVFDVAVDLRRGSPTYGRWYGETLSAENFVQLFIPAGFAHAYLTLSENVEFQYKVDAPYDGARDTGLLWSDPDIGIRWPVTEPVLSDKDRALPRLRDFDSPFVFDPHAPCGGAPKEQP